MSAQVKTRTRDLIDNPLGADGLEFVEFTSPDPERLGAAACRGRPASPAYEAALIAGLGPDEVVLLKRPAQPVTRGGRRTDGEGGKGRPPLVEAGAVFAQAPAVRAFAERQVEAPGGALPLVAPVLLEGADQRQFQFFWDMADVVAEGPGYLFDH